MKYIIYGAGLFGLTIGRLLKDSGNEVTIYEKTSYIGGACRTKRINNLEVHIHGAHIFHTDYDEVIDFVKKYSDWISYKHQVKALIGVFDELKYIQLPLSYQSISDFYDITDVDKIKWMLSSTSRFRHPNKNIENLISKIGWDLYDYVIKPYSETQWGTSFENIPLQVIDRIGFKNDFVKDYFTDKFQGLPKDGYDNFIKNLSDGLDIVFNVDKFNYDPNSITIFTGPIDDILNEEVLPYRTLTWNHVLDHDSQWQLPVINTPGLEHTRIISHHLFPNQPETNVKVTSFEFSSLWNKNCGLPKYYPINTEEYDNIYNKYVSDIKLKYPNLILGGRLGSYKYYDMDDTIYNAIKLFKSL